MTRFLTAMCCGAAGTFLCLQFTPTLWWIGLLLSFAVSYILYDLRGSIEAAVLVWKRADFSSRWSWSAMGGIIQEGFMVLLGLGLMALVGCTWVLPVLRTMEWVCSANFRIGDHLELFWLCSFMAGGLLVLLLEEVPGFCSPRYEVHLWKCTLPGSFIHILTLLIKGIARLPRAIRFLIGMGIEWYRIVHSKPRLLFAIDVAIGSGIGYYFHNPLVGGIVAAGWWAINYYLVAPRVLRQA